jgi:hypothetical protein
MVSNGVFLHSIMLPSAPTSVSTIPLISHLRNAMILAILKIYKLPGPCHYSQSNLPHATLEQRVYHLGWHTASRHIYRQAGTRRFCGASVRYYFRICHSYASGRWCEGMGNGCWRVSVLVLACIQILTKGFRWMVIFCTFGYAVRRFRLSMVSSSFIVYQLPERLWRISRSAFLLPIH